LAKRRKKTRFVTGPGLAILLAFLVILVSLTVRWLGSDWIPDTDGEPFQIEVLNGTGEDGIALKTAMELRKIGIDVLLIGDAEQYDFEESLLIDRKGNPSLMKKLSRLTGCKRILKQTSDHSIVDATFIVGGDLRSLRCRPSN